MSKLHEIAVVQSGRAVIDTMPLDVLRKEAYRLRDALIAVANDPLACHLRARSQKLLSEFVIQTNKA